MGRPAHAGLRKLGCNTIAVTALGLVMIAMLAVCNSFLLMMMTRIMTKKKKNNINKMTTTMMMMMVLGMVAATLDGRARVSDQLPISLSRIRDIEKNRSRSENHAAAPGTAQRTNGKSWRHAVRHLSVLWGIVLAGWMSSECKARQHCRSKQSVCTENVATACWQQRPHGSYFLPPANVSNG